ncbi:hypothetical protein ACWNXI_15820 [Caldibacillus thermoamylovorans]
MKARWMGVGQRKRGRTLNRSGASGGEILPVLYGKCSYKRAVSCKI